MLELRAGWECPMLAKLAGNVSKGDCAGEMSGGFVYGRGNVLEPVVETLRRASSG